ncbi:cytochrome c oxidase subunit II [Kroppenstedtia eburnea]|uniref:Cytochrome c oxidase subunit 2 n=1 Tax=Kroppenstedtia eburnea TaxID=714067 RepID=A0A1N7PN54_9BACL|nr:cytochrome c oxidase subunit II [Kroppenstedtia eburnea]QKI83223.1 cytochrome c oxidase subunit II [Kroppenstedtia eburnea]SIT11819.1 cytochrome c oxidase subunit 2 [Kroppenstedtia eburnea]
MSQGKRLALLLSLFAIFALVMTGCEEPSKSVFDPKGSAGEHNLNLIMLSVYIMTFVCVVVMAIYFYVLIRYRRKPGDNSIPKQVEGSMKLEMLWIIIPVILLVILAVPTLTTTFTLAEKPAKDEDAVRVKVTAHQYWWEFNYPDLGIKTAQELHIPVGKRVYLELISDDVVHSFWVPELGGKQDTVPGRTNHMWLDAKEPGVYAGRCAELCGASHALMNFEVVADEQGDFDKWVAQRQKPSSEPQTAEQEAGKKVFSQNCMSCHAIDGTELKTRGGKAPNLTGFSEREKIAGLLENNDENLDKWLKHPDQIKPGTYMPSFDFLSKKDMNNLKTYLESLE